MDMINDEEEMLNLTAALMPLIMQKMFTAAERAEINAKPMFSNFGILVPMEKVNGKPPVEIIHIDNKHNPK